MSNIKSIVARNLTELRKEENLTQGALAKMLNYSDKAVSKWECGDSLPDLEILKRLAEFYGVSLDYLVSENPEKRNKEKERKNNLQLLGNRIIISSIVVVSVFLIATIVFVYENLLEHSFFYWRAFLWAIPISAAVLLLFLRRWRSNPILFSIARSILLWSLVTCIYIQLAIYSFWYVFLVGIPIQILIILNHLLKTSKN